MENTSQLAYISCTVTYSFQMDDSEQLMRLYGVGSIGINMQPPTAALAQVPSPQTLSAKMG